VKSKNEMLKRKLEVKNVVSIGRCKDPKVMNAAIILNMCKMGIGVNVRDIDSDTMNIILMIENEIRWREKYG